MLVPPQLSAELRAFNAKSAPPSLKHLTSATVQHAMLVGNVYCAHWLVPEKGSTWQFLNVGEVIADY
jgi:hypothetical protein